MSLNRQHVRRDMWTLAILGTIAAASGVLFYYLQYHLTMTLWQAFTDMEQKAAEWREAFISKPKW